MKIVKPRHSDPIPLNTSKQSIVTILMRFVLFLVLAISVLLIAWMK